MGNQQTKLMEIDLQSKQKELVDTSDYSKIDFFGLINSVATKYILTQDFQEMLKLENEEYCDKLIIIVSNIFNKYLTDLEVQFLYQKIKDGKPVNMLARDNVFFLRRDNLDKLNILNKTKKKRMCIGISRFFIKIYEIYAAVVASVNPIYTYKNNITSSKETLPFFDKLKIPEYAKESVKIEKRNLCQNRINAFMQSLQKDITGENITVNISSSFCEMNNNVIDVGSNSQIMKGGVVALNSRLNPLQNIESTKQTKSCEIYREKN